MVVRVSVTIMLYILFTDSKKNKYKNNVIIDIFSGSLKTLILVIPGNHLIEQNL